MKPSPVIVVEEDSTSSELRRREFLLGEGHGGILEDKSLLGRAVAAADVPISVLAAVRAIAQSVLAADVRGSMGSAYRCP